jgi:hypothetical protein
MNKTPTQHILEKAQEWKRLHREAFEKEDQGWNMEAERLQLQAEKIEQDLEELGYQVRRLL